MFIIEIDILRRFFSVGGIMDPQPKPIRGWLLGILIIVILIAAGFYGWRYWSSKKTTQPTSQQSATADELSSLDNELNQLDQNFDQLDKINTSDDQTPTL